MDFSEAARGAKIYCTIKIASFEINITQTTVSLFAVTVFLMLMAFIVTRRISKRPGKLQVIVEKLVTMLYDLVEGTMGKHNIGFAPYIGTLFLSSFFCSTIGMTYVFRSATADLMVTLAWALVTSVLVWFFNIKNYGFFAWLKGFTEPIIIMTPMNIVSEIAQPVSMAFRHFGNMVGGSVLTTIIYTALGGATSLAFGWISQTVASIPFLQVGIPAFLSIYFDLFSGFVQALVFSLLTMVYVGAACPPPEERKQRKKNKNKKSAVDAA